MVQCSSQVIGFIWRRKDHQGKKIFWVFQRTVPTNGMEAKHTWINTDKNLLEPQMELFQLHHWLSEIQSLIKHRQTVDLGQTIIPNRMRAKCYLMRGWDFILTYKATYFKPSKSQWKSFQWLYFDMPSNSSSTKYVIKGFSSTECMITCQTSTNITWDFKVSKLCLSKLFQSILKHKLTDSKKEEELFWSVSNTFPLTI